jgi:adenosylcobinamide amidohydrolase
MEETGTKKGRGRKEEMKSRRKSSPYMTESAEIDYRQRLKEVGIDNEDKELMDEGNNVRYLRMN